MIEIKGKVDDPELVALARKLAPPEGFPSKLLGALKPAPRLPKMYEATRKLPGGDTYRILMRIAGPAQAPAAIGEAEGITLRVEKDLEVARLKAAEKLVDVYNESRKEGPQLTAPQIAARLKLDILLVFNAAKYGPILRFDDDGLFFGHFVEAQLAADGTVRAAVEDWEPASQ